MDKKNHAGAHKRKKEARHKHPAKRARLIFLAIPVVYSLFIFLGSVFARKLWEALNSGLHGGGGIVVMAGYVVACISVVAWMVFVKKDRKFSSYLSLALLAVTVVGLLLNMNCPDEKIHLGEFGMLAPVCYFAFREGTGVRGGRLFLYVFLFCALVGISDELVQFFVPGRYCDWKDMLTNIASSSIGVFITKLCFNGDGPSASS